jgi:hypothetical protein
VNRAEFVTHPLAGRASLPLSRLKRHRAASLQAALLAGALVLWAVSLQGIDVRAVGDLGLVSVLPATFYVAVGVVVGSFCWSMRSPTPATPVMLMHVVALVVILYGATALIEEVPRFNVVWRHAGVIQHLVDTGQVDPAIDAYFNWPGFFALGALVTEIAGVESALTLAPWAPVAFNLLCLAPLVLIVRAATMDPRVRWAAVWVFYLTNWVGQDYLATQAVAYVLFLSVLALVLATGRISTHAVASSARGLAERAPRPLRRLRERAAVDAGGAAAWTPGQRIGLTLVCVAAIGATVAGHQLTPFVLIAALAAIGILGDHSARGLAVVALAMTGAWLAYMAVGYLEGHLETLLDQTGQVNAAVSANVEERVRGSTEHVVVVRVRLLLTALLWGLATFGALRALRRGEPVLRHVALGLAPFAFLVLQPYGGEMLLRVYLFVLPIAALFAARLVIGVPSARWSWAVALRVGLLSAVLLTGFMLTRYGNERAYLFTNEEHQVVERLYDMAPQGSLLVASSPNLPWQGQGYAQFDHEPLGRHMPVANGPRDPSPTRLARHVASYMRSTSRPAAFLVFTRSQKVYEELLGTPPWGSTAALERGIRRSPDFRLLYRNRDGALYSLVQKEAS